MARCGELAAHELDDAASVIAFEIAQVAVAGQQVL